MLCLFPNYLISEETIILANLIDKKDAPNIKDSCI